MPEDTIASAVSRISFSSMPQPNVFQLFQPIGGVRASGGLRSAGGALAAVVPIRSAATTRRAHTAERVMDRTHGRS